MDNVKQEKHTTISANATTKGSNEILIMNKIQHGKQQFYLDVTTCTNITTQGSNKTLVMKQTLS